MNSQPRMIGRMIIWRTNYRGGRWIDQGALEYEGHAINRKIVMDYGLIVRTYNPFTSRDHTTILFAGSHTYGTIAAAKFFTEDLHKHLGQTDSAWKKESGNPGECSYCQWISDENQH